MIYQIKILSASVIIKAKNRGEAMDILREDLKDKHLDSLFGLIKEVKELPEEEGIIHNGLDL